MDELILTVSQLNEYLQRKFSSDALLKNIRVRGEITNFKINPGGAAYFTLKDDASAINCVMFDYAKTGFCEDMEDGAKVELTANISYYAKEGRVHLIVSRIEFAGIGELYIKLEELKRRLFGEGLFDVRHKKKLPPFPQALGVVTSAAGAAMHDIINVAKRRFPGIHIYVYPSKVQGPGAAEEVVKGIEYFNVEKNVDVIIVGRGGGSFEDLSAFNEEAVARAVFASEIPVVSAVGHEVDYSLCDLASDLRAPTPSAAAELCVPEKEGVYYLLQNYEEKINNSVFKIMQEFKSALSGLKEQIFEYSPEKAVSSLINAVNGYNRDISINTQNILNDKKHGLSVLKSRLAALNPFETLKRGYSIITDENGKAVSTINKLNAGDTVGIHFYDGIAKALIKKIQNNGDNNEKKV